ncbi:MAG: signal peptide peptidase SppA [Proteobacteria bacterium]|jgi:protease IV|nr:signal peptide peptidase SppA [Pseudomonadota bacterium]
MNFIKAIWKFIQKMQSFVGTFLFLIVMLIVSVFIFKAVFGPSSDEYFKPDGSALVINFNGTLEEQASYSANPYQEILSGNIQSYTLLRDVVKAIELAAKDNEIKILVLNMANFKGAYPSKLHYVGNAIDKFKQSGKKVITYGNLYDQSAYLIASFADEIYLHPHGGVMLYGYGSYQNYFLGFLEKINAEVQLFRVGKYKSAMEPFIRKDMSQEAKEANLELFNSLWQEYLGQISKQRNIPIAIITNGIENADQLLRNVGGDMAKLALDNGLIDGIMTREQWVKYMQDTVGTGKNNEGINQINHLQYLATKINMSDFDNKKDIVAVLYANGAIMDGIQMQGTVGGESFSRLIRSARLDKQVKAVVLRIDSPGGSAFASELIREEVLLLKEAGKPVIVSMGSVAASGGYWIAANADEIWASPTTITGSIGIFGAIPNLEGTLDSIGITTDGVGTTSLSTAAVFKPLPEKVKNIIQSNIENGYQRFLELVAEGRHMTTEQVDEIAQGRVWTGIKAQEIGLVDYLGYLDQAIEASAKQAELKEYRIVHWEDKIPFEMKIIAELFGDDPANDALLKFKNDNPQSLLIRKIMDQLSVFKILNDPQHAYVLCLNCMVDGVTH